MFLIYPLGHHHPHISFSHHHHHHQHQREKGELDMSHEYTCFLCNGYQTVIGSIIVDPVGIKLTTAIGSATISLDSCTHITK